MTQPYEYTPANDHTDTIVRWARTLLTLLLIPMARAAFRDDTGKIPLIGDIDVAVHEFGHNLFHPFGLSIFGDTMWVLGGSLFQCVFPLIFVVYFLKGRRDVHAAMVWLWWVGLNVLDMSVYMADARAGQLMLINGATGDEGSPHDWRILFLRGGMLYHDTIIAARFRALARALVATSIIGGLLAVWWPKPPQPADADAFRPSSPQADERSSITGRCNTTSGVPVGAPLVRSIRCIRSACLGASLRHHALPSLVVESIGTARSFLSGYDPERTCRRYRPLVASPVLFDAGATVT